MSSAATSLPSIAVTLVGYQGSPSSFGVTLLSQSHQLAALVGIAAPHGARLAAQAMLQVLDWHFLWAPDDWPDQPCYFFCSQRNSLSDNDNRR
jgi:hypothetical protein